MLNLPDALRFANAIADNAGEIAMRFFRRSLDVEDKADMSPVTVADRTIEAFLRTEIADAFPSHGIFGEEEAPVQLDRPYVWVIDPVDGTKSFVTGHPLFGCLMALLHEGEPCLGLIDMPATGERWCGILGLPSTMNGTPCSTSSCRDLSQAFAYTTDPFLFTGRKQAAFEMLREETRLLRFGGDCYAYALLASGFCDVVLETRLEPYDYLPVVQVVRGAGGVVTDWAGAPLAIGSAGDVLATSTPELHAQVLDQLARVLAAEAA